MRESEIIDVAISTVPHWYKCDVGPFGYSLALNDVEVKFYSHRRKTPHLNQLYDFIQENLNSWGLFLPELLSPSSIEEITEKIALKWLNIKAPGPNWNKLIVYLKKTQYRTYENSNVILNLVVKKAQGAKDITEYSLQKVLDPLASSDKTYMIVDEQLGYLGYEEISWAEVCDTAEYKFNPEFLQPFVSILKDNEYSAHLTIRRDIVILDKGGILASCRKGRWRIYERSTFKNFFVDTLGDDYRVGCNIFEILFDLSYKRHGALLVYDPERKVLANISNKNSSITPGPRPYEGPHQMIGQVINSIKMGDVLAQKRKKRLFLEVASIDGAVVFDRNEVMAFGAVIITNKAVTESIGARTAAAESAYHWGGVPIKISSDGDITIHFTSANDSGQKAHATLDFL